MWVAGACGVGPWCGIGRRGGLKLRIKAVGQYFVADEPGALTAKQLAQRLKREDPARFGSPSTS